MKCFNHNSAEAVGICQWCGRALCGECVPTTALRLVCSKSCGAKLDAESQELQSLLDKSNESARANAFYCHLTAVLSAGAALAAWFWLPSPFLIGFTGACAVVLVIAGIWHGRVARKSAAK